MGMRIRPIKPEIWEDKALHTRLNAAERECYIGLWMLADDTGLLEWDVEAIAAALYRYQEWQERERFVAEATTKIANLDKKDPHLVILPCKKHAEVTRLTRHVFVGRWSGAPYKAIRIKHDAFCRIRSNSRRVPMESGGTSRSRGEGGVGKGRVVSEESRARAHEEKNGGLKQRLGSFEDVISRGH